MSTNEYMREYLKNKNRETLDTATNKGLVWSDKDSLAVMDYTKTASQLAEELGRTLSAVINRRRILGNFEKRDLLP